jgi:hypothetical protein
MTQIQKIKRLLMALGFGSNIGRVLFVGWVSFLYPTYLPAIFMLVICNLF